MLQCGGSKVQANGSGTFKKTNQGGNAIINMVGYAFK